MALLLGGITIPVLSADPVDNPDAGSVFLYSVGGSYRMKTSSGTVLTFATGVTPEDVQDIVGTFLQAGSSKVLINYNDTLNVMTIDIDPTQIAHGSLINSGTNSHAQIDSHLANTSNPHATTKAQVGLGNVDNTSDANKPISTATQTALNLKYDASNPNGYETPAQLNARDTANRSRANHTGTQLAATISDFGSAVLGLLLAGYVVGANTAIAATDSILGAFQKLQGQINALITSVAGKENTITPTTAADYYRGDKTFQPLNKAAVGLANVDNTSDANKPISTATQTALNLKYDASNPNGYETPAQLNTRDTNNRARANHTGTQLSATISDFATTVLNTLLAGFTVGANTAIVAADTILAAFGKVQGQINFINSVLQSLVLGDQFENFEDNTAFTTTANTNQVAASFVTASKPLGKYRIAVEWDWSYNSATNDSIYAVFLDGIQVSQEFRYELSDTATQLLNNHFKFYSTFATVQTHTLELRCRAETAGSTVTVSRVRAEIWRATP